MAQAQYADDADLEQQDAPNVEADEDADAKLTADEQDGTQPSAGRWSQDAIRDAVERAVDQRLQEFSDKLYRSFDQRFTRVEQRSAEIAQLREQMAEALGSRKRADALLEALLEEQLGTEGSSRVRQQIEERIKREQLEQAVARYEREAQERAKAPPEEPPTEDQVDLQLLINEQYQPRERVLRKYAQEQGLDFKAVVARDDWPGKTLPFPTRLDQRTLDRYWERFEDAAYETIRRAADEAHQAQRPRTKSDTTQPAGTPRNSDQDIVNRTVTDPDSLTPAEWRRAQAAMDRGITPKIRRD